MLENRSITVTDATARPSKLRALTTNDPLRARTDRNTARGRRVADLYLALMEALGNPADILVQADVMAAAELRVACEDARQRVLDGGNGNDADQLVRLENLAHRAERKLGLDVKRKPEPAVGSLGAMLAQDRRGGGA